MELDIIRRMPKVELHCHLEGAIRLSTIAELGKRYNLPIPSYDTEELRVFIEAGDRSSSLADWMRIFNILRCCFINREVISRITCEVAEDYVRQNTRYLELRFSPGFMAKLNGITMEEAIEGVLDGMAEAERRYGIRMGAIVLITRDLGIEAGLLIAQCASSYVGRGIVGFDLAGNEKGNPPEMFAEAFDYARASGLAVTVHAGEECGPESIRGAIDRLGARRIGHGISLGLDPGLLERVRDEGIVLEMCPTSNVLTRNVKTMEEHPAYRYFKAGVPVTINADDPVIFATTLQQEYEAVVRHLGFSLEELASTVVTAAKAAFLPEEERTSLINGIKAEFAELGINLRYGGVSE
jgi:adenosine deaminase